MARRTASSTDLPIIALCATAAGAVMATGAISLFCIVMLGEPAPFVLAFSPLMALGGAALGLVSAAYLVPLLSGPRLSRSLPLVFGVSVPAGILMGTLHPLLGALAALGAQVGLGAIATATMRIGRGRTTCPHCGFDCRGVRDELCPECGHGGPDWRARNPELCECCGAGRVRDGVCEACGARDLNVAGLGPSAR